MMEISHLVIGRGEIGQGVIELLNRKNVNISTYDIHGGLSKAVPKELGVMHICFPYSDEFVKQVREYIVKYNPKHVIVWSTVAIGTCRQIRHNVVHSPVEGCHPMLSYSLRVGVRWLGSTSKRELKFFDRMFQDDFDLETYVVYNSDYTEALKLLSTSIYGVNLVLADYVDTVSQEIGMDYDLSKLWNANYNQLYEKLGMTQFKKYVLDPPKGAIGGHCILPNAAILNEQYPEDLLDILLEMRPKDGI
jgi:hypothetical protein